ncbi:MAG: redoxin domain-containing protein [Proteobacteria bacterium]|nr:redoxin domain-containing protein [Pseudomonadota bacterium]MCP4915335.1 redoxin domain-containing protein [Pseudomonadota bacterium]
MSVVRDMLRMSPLGAGEEVPPLSLTADEGTWVKIRDFKGSLNVVLVFFRSESAETEGYLRAIEEIRGSLEDMDTSVFAVNTAPTDRLRDLRAHLRVGFYFLYDPLALTARAFGVSRRVRPLCKDAVYIIGKDQQVLLASDEHVDPQQILSTIARSEGQDVPVAGAATPDKAEDSSFTRDPGKGPTKVADIDSVKAEELLTADDSPYILVDVRTKSEFDADHSVHATHIPVDELPHRYRELRQTDHLVFVCQGGDRSAAASEFMTSIGAFEIYNVVEGMSSWMGPRQATPVEEQ